MIIERVEIRNTGPFREPVSVGPLSPGLNILAARNESGKSTLVRALTRGLFDRHTCRSEEIRSLQPAGTSLAPRIAVVFRTGNRTFRIEKSFLESPRSQLAELVGGSWRATDEGDRADERLQSLLGSGQPGRGATKPEHWGMMQYLWARQGEVASWPAWSGEPGSRLRARLVKVELDPLIERLKGFLDRSWGEVLTETGRAKARGPLAESGKRLDDLRSQLETVQASLRKIDELEHSYAAANADIPRLESEAREREREAREIGERTLEVERLEREVAIHRAELERVGESLRRVEGDENRLRAAQATAAESERESRDLGEVIGTLRAQESELERERTGREAKLSESLVGRDDLRLHSVRTAALLRSRRLREEHNRLERQLKQARTQEAEARRLEEDRSRLPALTEQELRRLEDLERRVDALEAEIRSVGIFVELVPLAPAAVELREAGSARRLALEANATERVQAGQRLTLELEGWGRIELRSGSRELGELEEELRARRTELSGSLAGVGCDTIARAASLLERRRDLELRSREAERSLKAALDTFASPAAMAGEVSRRAAELESLAGTHRFTPEEESRSLAALEAREEELNLELKGAEERIGHLTEEIAALVRRGADLARSRNQAERDLAVRTERGRGAGEQIAGITARYADGVTAALERAQDGLRAARAVFESASRQLPSDAAALPERNRRAAKALAEVREVLDQRRREREKDAGALEALGSTGLYSQESELVGEIQSEEARARSARYRGWSARLLFDLIERRKQEATRAVLGPLEGALSSSFGYLTDDGSRRVFLDEDLGIRGVGHSGEDMVPFELLSQGAKEQLLLSLRIGVAATLGEEEPQSLILDDVLVHTDPARQERVLDLLETTARDLQILILTCHPDRYRGAGQQLAIEFGDRGA